MIFQYTIYIYIFNADGDFPCLSLECFEKMHLSYPSLH